ncbi:uracil phosphoribosyltransferase [Amycolatopsis mediterranei]|uniref:uracil phosphoribosyltransferase n=1 Tax=Amycolatopsis mediterranei TaxID=33910 RepID=UPI0034208FED
MQSHSFQEPVDSRLRIHVSADADEIKRELVSSPSSALVAGDALAKIARYLLESMRERTLYGDPIPVLILRGGLLMLEPFKRTFASTRLGLLAPVRDKRSGLVKIDFSSVPIVAGARYILLDVIVATGAAMITSLSHISDALSGVAHEVEVATPFLSKVGLRRLLEQHQGVTVNCIWHAEELDDSGRMRGPGFDVGDCALGHFGAYLNGSK